MQLIQEWHMNKAQQKNMDKNVKECCLSYVRVYKVRKTLDARIREAAEICLAAPRMAAEASIGYFEKVTAMAASLRRTSQ